MPLLHLQLPSPRIESLPLNGEIWKIALYEEYLPFFHDEGGEFDAAIRNVLQKFTASKFGADFRLQLHLNTVPFLVGFLFGKKEILIGSPRLHRELFLLQEIERNRMAAQMNEDQAGAYERLVRHVHKIIAIDMKSAPATIEQITCFHALPDFFENRELQKICEKGWRLEEEVGEKMEAYKKTLFEKISDFGLNLVAGSAILRIHLLKFVALLPALEHDKKGKEHKRIFLEVCRRMLADSRKAEEKKREEELAPLPRWLVFLLRLAKGVVRVVPARLLAKGVRFKIRWMARRFLAGKKIEDIEKSLLKLFMTHRDVTLDQLGEKVVSRKEADRYLSGVMKLIRGFSLLVNKGERNAAGILRAHLSLKVSALAHDFNPRAFDYTYEQVAPRLLKILAAAKRERVFVNIDAEHYAVRDLTFRIWRRLLLETGELKDYADTAIVIQAYLRDAYEHFEEVLALAKKRGIRMPIRLVKGAYWDQETIEAEAHGYDAPGFLNKEETDIHFRQLIYKTLEGGAHLQLCLASHNLSDHCFAEILRRDIFPDAPPIEHQCLHMTYEPLSWGMAEMGWPVRNYVTVGSLLAGMAYLVRRILENSSQAGILAQTRSHKEGLKQPFPQVKLMALKKEGNLKRDPSVTRLKPYFFNALPIRLYRGLERKPFEKMFGRHAKNYLGEDVSRDGYSGEIRKIYSPNDPDLLVGVIQTATADDCRRAVESLHQAYNQAGWAKAHPLERASVLLKAADLVLLKRADMAALIVHEGGKAVEEAIDDVNEAIDFLHFYAKEEERIAHANRQLVSRGVVAVIAPWNFPLAIPTGMAAAALAAGNTVALKPAEHTPLVTQMLTNILYLSGCPKDVFVHLPGSGATVGKTLVESEKVAGIVFTGSKAVGTWIAKTAGQRIARNELFGFHAPVKVITEMGGKNAVIVTGSAELDEAVSGILYSAFGNAGQKCSAASRVLVDQSIRDTLVERLREAVRDLKVGPGDDPATFVNPLIAMKEKERLLKAAKSASQEAHLYGGEVLLDRSQENLPGYCMGPVLIGLPPTRARHPDSFAMTELFGPVVHVIPYKNPKEAIRIFNAPEYALTGAVYSQSQDTIEFLQKTLEAGNLYVNRHCTGARVAIEPFGGFKLSGTGPKAGSTVYLDAFHVDLEGAQRIREKPVAIDREGIEKFRNFIARSLPKFVHARMWNRKIPGQTSYNDLSLFKETAFYIALQDEPQIKTIFYLLAGLSVGSHMTIIGLTEKSLSHWAHIGEFLLESGFRKEQFKVMGGTLEGVREKITAENPEVLIIEGERKEAGAVLKAVFDGEEFHHHMKTVLTALDAPSLKDFKRYLEPFMHVRSLAVNTMRHGAPLELEL